MERLRQSREDLAYYLDEDPVHTAFKVSDMYPSKLNCSAKNRHEPEESSPYKASLLWTL